MPLRQKGDPMEELEGKGLVCICCRRPFDMTEEERKMYRESGYRLPPRRCPDCRSAGRIVLEREDLKKKKEFPAICAMCGRETLLPFSPRGDRPVYCRDCLPRAREAGQEE